MKNDKICINKSVMFIATVLVILIGVVMATNYVNNQKLSTKSRADETNSAALGGGPVPVAEAGKFALSELKARAAEILRIKSSQLDATAMQKMQGELSSAQADAEKAFASVLSQVSEAGKDLESLITTNKANKKTAEDEVKVLFNAFEKAQGEVKTQEAKVKSIEESVAAAEEAYKKADEEYVLEVNILKQNIGFLVQALNAITTSKGPDSIPGRSALELSDRLTSADATNLVLLRKIDSDTIQKPTSGDHTGPTGGSVIEELVAVDSDLQIKYDNFQNTLKLAENKKKTTDDAKTLVNQHKAVFNAAKDTLAALKTDEGVAKKAYEDARNKVLVYGNIEDSLQTTLTKVKGLSITETTKLPAGIAGVTKLTGDTFGALITVLDTAQTTVDGVNAALTAANLSFDAFDKAIGGGKEVVQTQVTELKGYCAKVGGYPLLDANGLPAKVAEDFYKDPPPTGGGCAANENDPVWNGYFGSKSKCYTATGMCSLTKNPTDTGTIIGRDTGKACIYREVDMNKCLAKFPVSLKQQFEANNSLVCAGGKYFQIDGEYYQTGAEEAFDGSNYKYCVNKRIDPKDSVAIAAANTGIAQGLTDQIAKQTEICNKNGTFQSMPNTEKVTYLMSPLYGEPAQKVVVSHVCYQVGGMSSPNGSYCMNRLLPESGLCQCAKAGKKITFDGSKYDCEYLH